MATIEHQATEMGQMGKGFKLEAGSRLSASRLQRKSGSLLPLAIGASIRRF